jgi:hypothetical protein
MARETRSQTGNSKPRVVPVVDTAPTITRKAATKKKAVPKAEAKGAKPTGVTKKKSPVAKVGISCHPTYPWPAGEGVPVNVRPFDTDDHHSRPRLR